MKKSYSLKDIYNVKKFFENSKNLDDFKYGYVKNICLNESDVYYIKNACKKNGDYSLDMMVKYFEQKSGRCINPTIDDIKYILTQMKPTHVNNFGIFTCFSSMVTNKNDNTDISIYARNALKTLKEEDLSIKKDLIDIKKIIDRKYIDDEKISAKTIFEMPVIDEVEYQHILQIKQMQDDLKASGEFDLESSVDASLLSFEQILMMDPVTYVEYEFYLDDLLKRGNTIKSKRFEDLANNVACVDMQKEINDYLIKVSQDYYEVYNFEDKQKDKLDKQLRLYREYKFKLRQEYNTLKGKLGAEKKNVNQVYAQKINYYMEKLNQLKEVSEYAR